MISILFCRNKSETLPITTNCNIVCIAVAPDGYTAVLVDESTYDTIFVQSTTFSALKMFGLR